MAFRSKLGSLISSSTLKRCLSNGPTPTNPAPTSPLISIVIRSFDNPLLENKHLGGAYARRIGLPTSRVLYTVLRSPHIDKKSREQFEMKIKKQYLVIKTTAHELPKKFFWLKRQRIFGAQYEVRISCKTRLDMSKLSGVAVRSFSSSFHSEDVGDRDTGRSIGILSALTGMDGGGGCPGNNYGGGSGGGRED